jgi:glycerol-3-phosphate acyltransferase PlsX
VRVVVDAFGSDRAPGPEVIGALRAVRAAHGEHAFDVVLVGDAARLDAELAHHGRTSHDPITVVHASEVITMDDHPAFAFRAKRDSSMRVAVERVAEGHGDAVVSAGNSGAMLACALFVLGRLPGIERSAWAAR